MALASLLAGVAPVTPTEAQNQLISQQGATLQQQLQQALAPGQVQQQQIANQSAQQDMAMKKRALGISMLAPILNEPDPAKQQSLMNTLVPMFNRFVPDLQLDPEKTDLTTIRALAQSQVPIEDQAKMQMQMMGQMGGFGGTPNGIFPSMRPSIGTIMAEDQPPQATSGPPDSAAPSSPARPAAANPPAAPAGINSAYLRQIKMMNPLVGTMAEGMINGTFEPESGRGQNDPTYVAALQVAKRVDPSFNAQSLLGRPAMIKNATNGDMYKLETTLNTGMAHLYDLHELAPQAGNPPNTPYATNYLGGKIVTGLGLPGAQGISRYRGTLTTAAPEIAKYLGGGAATNEGTEHANSVFDENLPSDTIQTNAKDMGAKMMAKAGSLQHEYDTAMGAAASHRVANPTTEALFADMQGQPLTLRQQAMVNAHRAESNLPPKAWDASQTVAPANAAQQARGPLKPPPGTPIINSPSDPAFKALPSGAQFMSADGRMMVKH